jgi:hypothetical protein
MGSSSEEFRGAIDAASRTRSWGQRAMKVVAAIGRGKPLRVTTPGTDRHEKLPYGLGRNETSRGRESLKA